MFERNLDLSLYIWNRRWGTRGGETSLVRAASDTERTGAIFGHQIWPRARLGAMQEETNETRRCEYYALMISTLKNLALKIDQKWKCRAWNGLRLDQDRTYIESF